MLQSNSLFGGGAARPGGTRRDLGRALAPRTPPRRTAQRVECSDCSKTIAIGLGCDHAAFAERDGVSTSMSAVLCAGAPGRITRRCCSRAGRVGEAQQGSRARHRGDQRRLRHGSWASFSFSFPFPFRLVCVARPHPMAPALGALQLWISARGAQRAPALTTRRVCGSPRCIFCTISSMPRACAVKMHSRHTVPCPPEAPTVKPRSRLQQLGAEVGAHLHAAPAATRVRTHGERLTLPGIPRHRAGDRQRDAAAIAARLDCRREGPPRATHAVRE